MRCWDFIIWQGTWIAGVVMVARQHPHSTMAKLIIGFWHSAVPLLHDQFFTKSSLRTPHSSPVRARYGVSFVNSNSDLYSTSVTAVLCAISCYTGLHYNGTRLYLTLEIAQSSSRQYDLCVDVQKIFCNILIQINVLLMQFVCFCHPGTPVGGEVCLEANRFWLVWSSLGKNFWRMFGSKLMSCSQQR